MVQGKNDHQTATRPTNRDMIYYHLCYHTMAVRTTGLSPPAKHGRGTNIFLRQENPGTARSRSDLGALIG